MILFLYLNANTTTATSPTRNASIPQETPVAPAAPPVFMPAMTAETFGGTIAGMNHTPRTSSTRTSRKCRHSGPRLRKKIPRMISTPRILALLSIHSPIEARDSCPADTAR